MAFRTRCADIQLKIVAICGGSRPHRKAGGCATPEVEQQGLISVYDEIDAPLVPVVARMEDAGVKIDTAALSRMSTKLESEIEAPRRGIFTSVVAWSSTSTRRTRRCAVQQTRLACAGEVWQGQEISTAVDVLEGLAEEHEVPRLVLDYRQLTKLKSTYVTRSRTDSRPQRRVHTTFGQTGTATGRLSSTNPNLQNIPIRTELGGKFARHLRSSQGTFYSRLTIRRLNFASWLIFKDKCWWKHRRGMTSIL